MHEFGRIVRAKGVIASGIDAERDAPDVRAIIRRRAERLLGRTPSHRVRVPLPPATAGRHLVARVCRILLHVLGGYANELEFFAAESDVQPRLPVPNTVKVAKWSEPDSSGGSVPLTHHR
jgi:hypothetical protein